MPERLTVHLNRAEQRDVAPEATALETDRSFVLEFENHGDPLHVHVQLDEALDAVADPAASQVYVDEGETRNLEISVDDDHPDVEGALTLATGYGKTETTIDVTLTDRRKDGGPTVAVDETLSEKRESEVTQGGPQGEDLREFALATVGVLLAAAVALLVSDSAALLVGLLALAGGIVAGVYVLRSG